MKLREYFVCKKKLKITTSFKNSSPPSYHLSFLGELSLYEVCPNTFVHIVCTVYNFTAIIFVWHNAKKKKKKSLSVLMSCFPVNISQLPDPERKRLCKGFYPFYIV